MSGDYDGGDRRFGLGIFARAPVPGQTKTRLIPALGAAGAAALHRAFIDDTLCHAFEVGDCRVTLFHADPAPGDHLAQIAAQSGATLAAQEGPDLGERMSRALHHMLLRCEAAIVVGSDAPTLGAVAMRRALEALVVDEAQGARWCLGPSADGGYVCIGARRGVTLRFQGVRLGTRHALLDTIAANRDRRGVGAPRLLPPSYDIDTPSDLRLLRLHLLMQPDLAPQSAAALRNLGESPASW